MNPTLLVNNIYICMAFYVSSGKTKANVKEIVVSKVSGH